MNAAALPGFEPERLAINRVCAMPSPHTFEIQPIADLLRVVLPRHGVIVDPFSGRSRIGTHRNDLAHGGVDAEAYVRGLGVKADAVLFDPPYSPRQIAEVYQSVGLKVGTEDTQNARLYKRVKDALDEKLKRGGIAICCGWNSAGFGKTRGYLLTEILLVAHGGAHNDTIVTVEIKS